MINVRKERDSLLTDTAKMVLKVQYLQPGETIQEGFARACVAFCGDDLSLAQRLYDYVSRGWFMFATPLLANGGTNNGLPISCFLNYVHDSIKGITQTNTETCFLSTNGGGVGTYWGQVRSVGEKTSKGNSTPGVMPFIKVQDSISLAFHQGSTRRGSAAVYLDVTHPEIVSFVRMRLLEDGDNHRKSDNLHHGVNITDEFMQAVIANVQDWKLIDPHTKKVTSTIGARELFELMVKTRLKKGEPYFFFVDTANKDINPYQREKGLKIFQSNLCTEITLPTTEDRTAVCCLSSINLARYDEWKDVADTFVADLVTMLDNALTVFVEKAPPEMKRAVDSVLAERSIGLGTLGFASYLQLKNKAIDSEFAVQFNEEVYSLIKEKAVQASKKLAQERGEPSDLVGSGMRNAYLLAIAPNEKSSIICGSESPGIEPYMANSVGKFDIVGGYEIRNKYLANVLENYGKNTQETWTSISRNKGSVAHLDFLSTHEKNVFKTAYEIDQFVLLELAAQRQKYICQAQSLNLFIKAKEQNSVVAKLHIRAWELGLKSLYYLHGTAEVDTNTGTVAEKLVQGACSINDKETCSACEG